MGTIEHLSAGYSAAHLPPGAVGGLSVVGRLGERREHRLALGGRFSPKEAGAVWSELRRKTAMLTRGDRLDIDMGAVERIDGSTMALIVHLRSKLAARGVIAELTEAREHVQTLISLYAGDAEPARKRRRRPVRFLEQVGRSTLALVYGIRDALAFLGSFVSSMAGLVRRPRSGNWKAVLPTMGRTGADAVPIVLLINFLIGFVIAHEAAGQLESFGAGIYVANLVGSSMTREMAPLMTAIILTGRSGAAFAAELGSMKVGEEIDALRTMGFGSVRYLVMPRVLALVLVIPVLTLMADAVGILGGYVVAVSRLHLSATTYFHALQHSVVPWDVFTGLIKSVAFGITIALISCQQGFAASGGAEGVGRRTTASVVQILVALIVLDAGFTLFFQVFGV